MENKEIQGKDIALISYLTLIGLVIAFVMNNDKKHEFAKFHIRQSLGLFLTAIVFSFINIIPFLGWMLWFFGIFVLLFMWIKGLLAAVNGREEKIPFLGNYYTEWFKNI